MKYLILLTLLACNTPKLPAQIYQIGDTLPQSNFPELKTKFTLYRCSWFGEVFEITKEMYRVKFFCENEIDLITGILI